MKGEAGTGTVPVPVSVPAPAEGRYPNKSARLSFTLPGQPGQPMEQESVGRDPLAVPFARTQISTHSGRDAQRRLGGRGRCRRGRPGRARDALQEEALRLEA